MKIRTLKNRILLSFLLLIIILGVAKVTLIYYVVERDIIQRAQQQVDIDLKTARSVYAEEIANIARQLNLVEPGGDIGEIKKQIGLDYLYVVDRDKIDTIKSMIAKEAFNGKGTGGTRIIDKEELQAMGDNITEKIKIKIIATPKARAGAINILDSAMAMEYALPLFDEAGNVKMVIYGGKIINNTFTVVNKIHDLIFENKLYESKPVGTVTIFQDDIRISTNVLDEEGKRAIGTKVSEVVYDNVVSGHHAWLDKAFVLNDLYFSAYEPIKDVKGKVIGILYVGILEKPFRDMTRNILFKLMAIIFFATLSAVVLSYILTVSISRPINSLLDGTKKLSGGDMSYRVKTQTSLKELIELADAFNQMAEKIDEREKSLEISNEKLVELNKTYLDLIGFVAHELKGILASTTLNAYTVRDGFLGMINFKQRRALDSITRNLDHLDATVKNFLNLSRIEKGEIKKNNFDISLREDVINMSVETFARQAIDKNMEVINNIEKSIKIKGDPDLLTIAANNLVGNAIKYGLKGGKVILNSSVSDDFVEIEVYNDGIPLSEEDKGKLFKKFSRLTSPDKKKVRGTGLGLFVTKDIIEKHGGSVWIEAKENGNSFKFKIERGC